MTTRARALVRAFRWMRMLEAGSQRRSPPVGGTFGRQMHGPEPRMRHRHRGGKAGQATTNDDGIDSLAHIAAASRF